MSRVELKNEELEAVVGGAWNFVPNGDGSYTVTADRLEGTWTCPDIGHKENFSYVLITTLKGQTLEQKLEWLLANGYLK